MLVLSRKSNESILIGDDIEVVVLEMRGNVVRLGIKAPREIPVIRAELRERQVNLPDGQPHIPSQTPNRLAQIPIVPEGVEVVLHQFCERRRVSQIQDNSQPVSVLT